MNGRTSWTILDVLSWTTERFTREGIDSPRLDAEVLLAHCLGMERIRLYVDHDKPMSPAELTRYRATIKRRLAREPVAYITGSKEFWSMRFAVSPAVLIPRPETELLVQVALKDSCTQRGEIIVDVGTGSGAIAVVLARELPGCQILATEFDAAALEVAHSNAKEHQVDVTFFEGDLLSPLPSHVKLDLVVANLPYVASTVFENLAPEVSRWEPRQALNGGADGLDLIRRLAEQAKHRLRDGGGLMLEIGFEQGEAVQALLQSHGFGQVKVHQDLGGCDRVVTGRLFSSS